LNEVVVWRGLRAPRAPEHRLAVVGIGLGIVVTEQFALPGVRRRDLRRRGQLETGLVERFARLHNFGAEPDRLVARLWIRQTGREVRRVEGVTIARRGVDQDVDFGPGRTRGEGTIEVKPIGSALLFVVTMSFGEAGATPTRPSA